MLTPQLARDELGERRLAEPGRTVEERVVERLAARERRVDGDLRSSSLTFCWPMNSASRCGRSDSSTDALVAQHFRRRDLGSHGLPATG